MLRVPCQVEGVVPVAVAEQFEVIPRVEQWAEWRLGTTLEMEACIYLDSVDVNSHCQPTRASWQLSLTKKGSSWIFSGTAPLRCTGSFVMSRSMKSDSGVVALYPGSWAEIKSVVLPIEEHPPSRRGTE